MLVWLEQVLGVEPVAFFHHTLIIFIFLRYLFLLIMCMQNKRIKVKRFKVYLSFTINIIINYTYCTQILMQIPFGINRFFIFHVFTFINDSMRLLEPILDESLVIIWITVKMLIGWFVYVPSFLHKLTFLYVNWNAHHSYYCDIL